MEQPTSRKVSHLQERGSQPCVFKMLISHPFTAPLTFPFKAEDAGALAPGDPETVLFCQPVP